MYMYNKNDIKKKIKMIKVLFYEEGEKETLFNLLRDPIWDDIYEISRDGDLVAINVDAFITKICNEPQKVSLEDFEYIEKLLEENK